MQITNLENHIGEEREMIKIDYSKKEIPTAEYTDYTEYIQINSAKPHLCPVCHGKGLVPFDFYLSNMSITIINPSLITCRTCIGAGVLWG